MTKHRQGIRAATEHLLGLGHRRITLIAGHPETWVGREQTGGFLDAASAFGIPGNETEVFHVGELGRVGLSNLLRRSRRPTAIIANINEVSNVLSAATELQLAIPRDLSVISIGDTDFLTLTTPPITAVCGTPDEVGRRATALLLKRLSQPAVARPERVSIGMEVVLRASTATVPRAKGS